MKKIVVVILIICIIATFSVTYLFVNNVKNEEINNLRIQYEQKLENKNTSYNELYDIYAEENDALLSEIDCLSKGNIDTNPVEEKSLLIGTWNRTYNGTIDDTGLFTKVFGEDGYYYPHMTGLYHSWRLVNTSCGLRVVILTMDSVSSIFSYNLSENNTILTIGEETYIKTS